VPGWAPQAGSPSPGLGGLNWMLRDQAAELSNPENPRDDGSVRGYMGGNRVIRPQMHPRVSRPLLYRYSGGSVPDLHRDWRMEGYAIWLR
jgi:hypothetical protein